MSVALEIADGLALIRLDRPDKLNALNAGMIAALADAADRIDADDRLRMAVLTGSGRAFCVGGDVAAWSALDPIAMGQHWVRDGHRAFDRLARLRVPLVAVLNGPALGGGLELAATADLRIAEPAATLGLPETGIGMVPGWSGTQRLTRRFGAGPVRRMTLFGERFAPDVALRLGLVDEVVADGKGLARARTLAAAAASSRGRLATVIAKQLVNAAEGEEGGAVAEMLAGSLVSFTDELREGVAAFREKRAPRFG
jgi:enoyl-CoA hydratase